MISLGKMPASESSLLHSAMGPIHMQKDGAGLGNAALLHRDVTSQKHRHAGLSGFFPTDT